MLSMNDLVDLQFQQHLYRQQIMQRIPDPFPPMLPFHMSHHIIVPQRPTLPGVEAKLENNELWTQFHKIGTEMIITKSGRRMFPSMRISVSGLEDDSNYCVLLEMVPIGDCRYKFSGSHWIPAGGAEPQSPQRMFLHPDSPATGAHWQSQAIIFNKVKLTNNTLDNNGHIVLASMHKYQSRLHIIRTSDLTQLPWAPQQAFVFPETEFVAVTAYQNDRITKLKIDNNPFAKGFRETGQSRCKRKLSPLNDEEQDTFDNPPSPSKSSLVSNEDDRISVVSGLMDSLPAKRVHSNGSCDDESNMHSISSRICGSLSPYYDEPMYSAMVMYQHEHLQPQLLSPSPLDIAAATYFATTANISPPVSPESGMQPLLMQLPLHRLPQRHLPPSQLPPHLHRQLATTSPANTTGAPKAVLPPFVEEQSVVDSAAIVSEVARPLNETEAGPKPAKRNNFSISAILAF
ncbi:T-box transcription factor TBX6-like [Anastrepha obliqua]|uniref:T-box transcription factor TBX6-like n=1 Tax=Anastrepha obliqua TaxID=95512 RepID=UPI0024094223|nr:T-box transcription factor TBX6-like [Anastrepha obliqua]